MRYTKTGLALGLALSFGLFACGDSENSSIDNSSSNAADENDFSSKDTGSEKIFSNCKIQKNPFKVAITSENLTIETAITFNAGEITTTSSFKYSTQTLADQACKKAKSDASCETKCEGKTVSRINTEEGSKDSFLASVINAISMCEYQNNHSADTDSLDESEEEYIDESSWVQYQGNDCNFDINDDKWEFSYTSSLTLLDFTSDVEVKCTRSKKDDSMVKCVQTTTSSGDDVNLICGGKDQIFNSSEENSETCKDGRLISVETTTESEFTQFFYMMDECQKANGVVQWGNEEEFSEEEDDDSEDSDESSNSAKETTSDKEEADGESDESND